MSCFHGKLQAGVLKFGGRLLGEAGPLRRRGGGQPGRLKGLAQAPKRVWRFHFARSRIRSATRAARSGVEMSDATTKLTPLSDALAGDLSSDQLAALEDALPTLLPLLDDAEALKSRLKALGVAKLGHRLKVFGVLQRYEPPPPPSESGGFWERIAAGAPRAAVADSDELPIARALASPAPVPAPAEAVPTVPPTPPMPPPGVGRRHRQLVVVPERGAGGRVGDLPAARQRGVRPRRHTGGARLPSARSCCGRRARCC